MLRTAWVKRRRVRLWVACAATAAVVGPLVWLWQDSLPPARYSVMDMGYADRGGGPDVGSMAEAGHHAHAMAGRSVTTLTADPDRPADVTVSLVARKQRFQLPSGRTVDGYTLNGQSPGPVIRATAGPTGRAPSGTTRIRCHTSRSPAGCSVPWW
jgi:hypothetical protein